MSHAPQSNPDVAATRTYARAMDLDELRWAVKDRAETADATGALERAGISGTPASYYRAEAAIFNAEIRRRTGTAR